MARFRTITLPDEAELTRRLTTVSADVDLVRGFYPIAARRAAGRELTGEGVVINFTQSIASYTNNRIVGGRIRLLLKKYMEAIIDDEKARTAAIAMIDTHQL